MEGIFAASVVFDRLVIVYLDVSFSRRIVDGIEMKCVQKVRFCPWIGMKMPARMRSVSNANFFMA